MSNGTITPYMGNNTVSLVWSTCAHEALGRESAQPVQRGATVQGSWQLGTASMQPGKRMDPTNSYPGRAREG